MSQAADLISTTTSIPSLNVTPLMTFDNRLWPCNRRQVLEAAITSLNTIRRAVSCDNAPFIRTLLTFFDFPADHWDHLRTSNPIESVFATVRHRTVRMKGALSQDTARLMVFKLVMAASKTWRRLQGQNQLPKVINGVKFKDGIEAVDEIKSAA
jgi:putative transposase